MELETLALRAGYKPGNGETHTMPIYQSTTYEYTSADHMAHLFDQPTEGHIYSRISNPTVGFVEEKIAAMEGGVGALMTTSGQAARKVCIPALRATSIFRRRVSPSSKRTKWAPPSRFI